MTYNWFLILFLFFQDVLAGLAFVFGLMVVCFPFLDSIDNFILTHRYAPAALILVPLIMALCYPTIDKWNTARGDTTLILGVGSGIGLGHWFSFQYDFMQRSTTLPPYQIIWPTWHWFGQMLLRLALGVVILIATRVVMKLLSYNLVCYVVGVSKEDMRAHKKLSVELPYKLITYTFVAFNSVFLAPQIFRYLGIERETYFTELWDHCPALFIYFTVWKYLSESHKILQCVTMICQRYL